MKLNLKRYVGIAVFIGLIMLIDGMNLSLWYVFVGMMAFGLYMHRAWLKSYSKQWWEQYKLITKRHDKNGKER